jgi:transcription-repair coupling factor (superfamily II helicase)
MDLSGLLPILTRAKSLRPVFEDLPRRLTLGVNEPAKAALLAALATARSRPVVLVTSRLARAQALAEEIEAWAESQLDVRLFPERDALPYEYLAPDLETVRERVSVLAELNSGRPYTLVVAAIGAAAQPTLGPADLEAHRRIVRRGDSLRLDIFVRELDRLGYQVEPIVDRPGVVSRRGGIVDLFPAHLDQPVRIELLGNEIETMRTFEPSSQRSLEEVEAVELTVARELPNPARPARDLAAALDFTAVAEDVRERWQSDLELLQSEEWFPAEAYYTSFLGRATLFDYVTPDTLLVLDEPPDVENALGELEAQAFEARVELEDRSELPHGLPSPYVSWESLAGRLSTHRRVTSFSRWVSGEEGEDHLRLPFSPATTYGGSLPELIKRVRELASTLPVVVVSQQAQRIAELFREDGVEVHAATGVRQAPEPASLSVVQGALGGGWIFEAPADGAAPTREEGGLALLTDAEIFGFRKQRRARPRRSAALAESVLPELSEGDYVVHIDHGVARFAGTIRRPLDGHDSEYLELHYAEGDRLYVPVDQADRVARYVGPGEGTPSLTRLGTMEWQRTKARVRRAVAELAQELLELYASRELAQGYAFDEDTPWQLELEASFPFVETRDQLLAIQEVKADMERVRPMDRLVCGDVGYGKTEVAIRAAFKVIQEGKQVGVLVPTTVLAQQHFNTFRERLAGFPVNVEMLSRFRSSGEQRKIVNALSEGELDIVIGTHRLLSQDVKFKDLGLVVIDEEQRFGVAHKERLKRMRSEVDVLTLSATPIPRTLHMSLTGIRDMSTIDTPPESRLPIKTYVAEFDDHVVREAILRELDRGGQVYVVHNRVRGIEQIAAHIRRLVPEAKVAVAHGQMHEDQLERVMLDFAAGDLDVLVCTTIIESGLDIPNVNTIIINRADMLGLSQLYQLRGRVGRGANRAYAYLLFDQHRQLSEVASRRLQTIFEAQELGAGFQIAMRDLEIRGAGNILGAEQSGQIGAVGFDLYTRLLREQVDRVRALRDGGALKRISVVDTSVQIELPLEANIPQSYIEDMNVRLAAYKRLAEVDDVDRIPEAEAELRDRFGDIPPEVEGLLYIVRLRALGRKAGVKSIKYEGPTIIIQMLPSFRLERSLASEFPPNTQVGPTQVRLDRPTLGPRWQDELMAGVTRLGEIGSRGSEVAALAPA